MKKNDRIIAVASGFETKNSRSLESLKLLNWGLEILIHLKFQKKVKHFMN